MVRTIAHLELAPGVRGHLRDAETLHDLARRERARRGVEYGRGHARFRLAKRMLTKKGSPSCTTESPTAPSQA
jgi:hypothetical protein